MSGPGQGERAWLGVGEKGANLRDRDVEETRLRPAQRESEPSQK